jgi:hypothetical protein
MKWFSHLALLAAGVLTVGCSEKTKVETKEAVKQSGEAIEAAAEDAKVNIKKSGKVLKSAAEKAKEEFSERPKSGEEAPDADAAPNPQGAEP